MTNEKLKINSSKPQSAEELARSAAYGLGHTITSPLSSHEVVGLGLPSTQVADYSRLTVNAMDHATAVIDPSRISSATLAGNVATRAADLLQVTASPLSSHEVVGLGLASTPVADYSRITATMINPAVASTLFDASRVSSATLGGNANATEAVGRTANSELRTDQSGANNQSIAILSSADIGHLVRNARKRKGLSQQAFADLAGVGRRFLSELENGKATLELGKVLVVSRAAGVRLFAAAR